MGLPNINSKSPSPTSTQAVSTRGNSRLPLTVVQNSPQSPATNTATASTSRYPYGASPPPAQQSNAQRGQASSSTPYPAGNNPFRAGNKPFLGGRNPFQPDSNPYRAHNTCTLRFDQQTVNPPCANNPTTATATATLDFAPPNFPKLVIFGNDNKLHPYIPGTPMKANSVLIKTDPITRKSSSKLVLSTGLLAETPVTPSDIHKGSYQGIWSYMFNGQTLKVSVSRNGKIEFLPSSANTYRPPPPTRPNMDPRRAKPEGVPMTKFLMEIGRQYAFLPHTVGIELEECQKMVQMALQLGDIIEVGVIKLSKRKKLANAMCSRAKQTKSYPVYQFIGHEASNLLQFSLTPDIVEHVETAVPPRVSHAKGQVHSGMLTALWGGYCYDHPCQGDLHGDFEDLIRGMRLRYSGQP